MEEVVPQVSEVLTYCGDASMYAAWPGVLRDALRRAGSEGLFQFQLFDVLALRDVIESNAAHQRAMTNALEYLEAIGLACRNGARWFDIPVLPLRSLP